MPKGYTATERAAAVIIALGSESASQVYKFLHEDEIEQVSIEISKLERMPPDDMKEVIDDFYGMCITQKVIAEGGVSYAKDVLEKAFGAQQAVTLMDRVSKSLKTKAFDFIRKADYKNLLMMMQNEHPQTIALILSYARADQASQIVSELPQEVQIEVIKRIANLDRANPEMISLVEASLEKKFSSIVSMNDLMELGGVNYVADIMNNVDRGTEKHIFEALDNQEPDLSDEIRKRMFVFEDIVFMDNVSIQRFIRDVDGKDLAVALKAANEDVTNIIFTNMSQRMQESVKQDIEYLHNVRMRDVEEAQQKIVSIIRKLEEENEIVISKGGKDDIIA
ncbi:MAG: flagellar motor switch protein FliG [Oscillospiraceae bacterium]